MEHIDSEHMQHEIELDEEEDHNMECMEIGSNETNQAINNTGRNFNMTTNSNPTFGNSMSNSQKKMTMRTNPGELSQENNKPEDVEAVSEGYNSTGNINNPYKEQKLIKYNFDKVEQPNEFPISSYEENASNVNNNIYDNNFMNSNQINYNEYKGTNFNNSNYNYSNNFNNTNTMNYNKLLNDYNKVLKEKDEVESALKEQILQNENQKSQLNLLKAQVNSLYNSKNDSFSSKHSASNNNNMPLPSNNLKKNLLNKPNKKVNLSYPNDNKYDSNDGQVDYAELTLNLSKLNKENNEYKKKISQLESKINEGQKDNEKLNNENLLIKKNNSNLQQQIDKLSNKNKQIQTDLLNSSNKINEIEKEKEVLTTERSNYAKIEDDYNKLITEKEYLIGKNIELNQEREKLYGELQFKTEENNMSSQKMNSYIKKIEYLNENIKLLECKINDMFLENNELKATINNYMILSQNMTNENQIFLNQIESLKNDNIEKVNDKQNLINELNEKSQNLKKQNEDLNTKHINNTKEIEDLKSKLTKLQTDYTNMKTEYENNKKDLDAKNNEYIKMSNDLIQSKSLLHDNEKTFKEKLLYLTEENMKINRAYVEKNDLSIKALQEKESRIQFLQYQIDNPQINENPEYFNPKLAIQSCLIASRGVLENAHNYYSEEKKNLFFESIEKLRRELEILYQSLNKENSAEAKIMQISAKQERTFKELMSYRQDNQKLFMINHALNIENNTIKKMNNFLNSLLKKIIVDYINEIELKNILKDYWETGVKYIYESDEIEALDKKIEEYKKKLCFDDKNDDKDKNAIGEYEFGFNKLYNKNQQYEELKQLEKERENHAKQFEEIKKFQSDCELKLSTYSKFNNNHY